MTISKPMLSATVHEHELDRLVWPLVGSPKLDGIRVLNHPELGPVTRSFKPVPNNHIRETLQEVCLAIPLDGELIALNEDGIADFNSTQSCVMTRGGQPRFIYAVFDCFQNPEDPFMERLAVARHRAYWLDYGGGCIDIVEHTPLNNQEEFIALAAKHLEQGHEGTMLRDPMGPYKSGRSTLKQQGLIKYKEWADAEGTVVGFEERMHNANEDIKDNFGHAKRTSHKENMVPMGTLGALILDTAWGELRVGTGFDDFTRQTIWNMREGAIGRIVTFKYQAFGMQDKPRFPVFMHFRENE